MCRALTASVTGSVISPLRPGRIASALPAPPRAPPRRPPLRPPRPPADDLDVLPADLADASPERLGDRFLGGQARRQGRRVTAAVDHLLHREEAVEESLPVTQDRPVEPGDLDDVGACAAQ